MIGYKNSHLATSGLSSTRSERKGIRAGMSAQIQTATRCSRTLQNHYETSFIRQEKLKGINDEVKKSENSSIQIIVIQ